MDEISQTKAVNEYISTLEHNRKIHQRSGNYDQAAIAKTRSGELKFHQQNCRKEMFRMKQLTQQIKFEERQRLELQQLFNMWDSKFLDLDDRGTQIIDSLKIQQECDFQKLQETIVLSRKPRYSKELQDLRRIEKHLMLQKEYAEAQKIKVQCEDLETWEVTQWQNEGDQERRQQEATFKLRQKQELGALQKKINTGKEDLKKQRQYAFERFLQRYQKVKEELQQQLNSDRVRHEKFGL